MTVLIHVLGSDIPYRNRIALRLFNNALATTSEYVHEFVAVGRDNGLSDSCLTLSVQFFPGKKSPAEAVIAKTKANRQQRFFFHDQLNPKLWLALLSGDTKPNQFFWHIQGVDLCESSSGLRRKFFYPLRRLVQKGVGCVFAIHGGLGFFAKTHPKVWGELLYFPTRVDLSLDAMTNNRQREGKVIILMGNSGDRSDERIAALRVVYQQFSGTVKVVVSMEYPLNNEAYIEEVRQAGLGLFSEENLQVLSEKLEFGAYLTLLHQRDLGCFIFTRQQGIGTPCLLIQTDIPYVFNRENPFWQDMTEQHLLVLFTTGDLNEDIVRETQRQLASVDENTIAFFSPNYLQGWQWALAIAAGEVA